MDRERSSSDYQQNYRRSMDSDSYRPNEYGNMNRHPRSQYQDNRRSERSYNSYQAGNDRYNQDNNNYRDYSSGNYQRERFGYENNGYSPAQSAEYDEKYEQRRYSRQNQYGDNNYHPHGERNFTPYRQPREPRYGNNNAQSRGRYNNNNNPYRQRPQRNEYNEGYGAPNNNYYGNNRPNNNFSKNNKGKKQRSNQSQQRVFHPRPKPIVYTQDHIDVTEPIRLNKYMANSGVCSRREADELIQAGKVMVNGVVVSELGAKVYVTDEVKLNDQLLSLENKVYVLLNKPKNCVTTSDDPQERLTVLDLVKTACKERIYPVGRLDRNTTGVLLLTNDGDLATKLMHPSYDKKKIYHVWLDKPVAVEDMQKIADGIELEDGEIHADAISYVSQDDMSQVGIEIHSGRNRIVRRIFEHLGYKVYKLDRVYFAGLTKKNLGKGKWRYLSQEEVNMLRMGAFE
ncbi:pseudouridine synthase [Porphyromonas canoris]